MQKNRSAPFIQALFQNRTVALAITADYFSILVPYQTITCHYRKQAKLRQRRSLPEWEQNSPRVGLALLYYKIPISVEA
jgi:hypothetical protein